jgi:transcriptional regulator with XRE-family HTH domain
MTDAMRRKKPGRSDFGKKLAELRKARGLSQMELAQAIGTSQRAISSYETQASYPPAPVVADLARGLGVATDELLGLKSSPRTSREPLHPQARLLRKKLQQVLTLPERDQRAIIRLINSLVSTKGNGDRR